MNIKISEVSLSVLINAYKADHNIELTESETVAVCQQLGVRYGNHGVQELANVPDNYRNNIREYATDMTLLLDIANQDDVEDDMIKEAGKKYQEFLSAVASIRERYGEELAETRAEVYSTIDKVLQQRTDAE